MRYGLIAFIAVATLIGAAGPAVAGSTSIGGSFTTERAPDRFSETLSSDWQADLMHVFDNKVSVQGVVKYYDTADTSDYKLNVQFAVGYTVDIGSLALTATTGIGQHYIYADTDKDFPYYFFTIAGTVPIAERWTWTMFRLRYRNAFDSSNDYETPEIATGVNFNIDDHNTVTLFIERDWTDGRAAYDGIEIGYRYKF